MYKVLKYFDRMSKHGVAVRMLRPGVFMSVKCKQMHRLQVLEPILSVPMWIYSCE